jgi:hypothetical protein
MIVSYAVVHDDPPEVYLAEDVDTLQWVLALRVVAQSPAASIDPADAEVIRAALLAEEWGQAVFEWIQATGRTVDVYPSIEVHEARHVVMGPAELQFTPLFRDG